MLTGCEFGTDPCKSSPDACSPNAFAHPSPEQPPEPPHRTGALSALGVCTSGRGWGRAWGWGCCWKHPAVPRALTMPLAQTGLGRVVAGGGQPGTAALTAPRCRHCSVVVVPRGDRTHEAPMGARTLQEPKEPACVHPPPQSTQSTHGCTHPRVPLSPGRGQPRSPPPAPPPRRSAVQVSGPAGARGGAQSSGGGPGTAAGGGCWVVPATPPVSPASSAFTPRPQQRGAGRTLASGRATGVSQGGDELRSRSPSPWVAPASDLQALCHPHGWGPE